MRSAIFAEAAARWAAMRQDYQDYLEAQLEAAQRDLGPYLTNRLAQERGIDADSLFTGPWARVERYASPELLEWFARNGRLTVTEYEAQWVTLEPPSGA